MCVKTYTVVQHRLLCTVDGDRSEMLDFWDEDVQEALTLGMPYSSPEENHNNVLQINKEPDCFLITDRCC